MDTRPLGLMERFQITVYTKMNMNIIISPERSPGAPLARGRGGLQGVSQLQPRPEEEPGPGHGGDTVQLLRQVTR